MLGTRSGEWLTHLNMASSLKAFRVFVISNGTNTSHTVRRCEYNSNVVTFEGTTSHSALLSFSTVRPSWSGLTVVRRLYCMRPLSRVTTVSNVSGSKSERKLRICSECAVTSPERRKDVSKRLSPVFYTHQAQLRHRVNFVTSHDVLFTLDREKPRYFRLVKQGTTVVFGKPLNVHCFRRLKHQRQFRAFRFSKLSDSSHHVDVSRCVVIARRDDVIMSLLT